MAGWNLKEGICKKEKPTDHELWEALNHMFKNTHKTTTYKFCFLKCLVDYAAKSSKSNASFSVLFQRFAEIYWDLIVKYGLCHVYINSKFKKSKVELLIESAIPPDNGSGNMQMNDLPEHIRNQLLRDIALHCSQNVVGAFYESTYGLFYGFSKANQAVTFSDASLRFLDRYHDSIEEINYFNWAKMIEKINGDSTPKSLVTKMSRLGKEVYADSVIVMSWPSFAAAPVQKFNLEDTLPWSF